MENRSVSFYRYGRKYFLLTILTIVFVAVLIYFVYPKGFWTGLASGGIYFLIILFVLPVKYVLTEENRLETYFIFGKMKSRDIEVDKILELQTKKRNQLTIKYNKNGFSQPTWSYLKLNNRDMKEMQQELLKRNNQISLK